MPDVVEDNLVTQPTGNCVAREATPDILEGAIQVTLQEEEVELEEMLAVKRTAYTLNNVVYITTSIIKELGVNPLVFTFLKGV